VKSKKKEGVMGKTLEEEYLAEYFIELKERARELAGKQVPDEWWDLWFDHLRERYSETEIEELKKLAGVKLKPHLRLVK
jgi:hypothetical protein